MNAHPDYLERRWPEPELVEAPPLVSWMKRDVQDGYIAEFAENEREAFELVVFDSLCRSSPYAKPMIDALAAGDHTSAGMFLAAMARKDVIDAIDRRRGAL